MLHGRFAHVGKTLTHLQILGCKLHQNTFSGGLRSDPLLELLLQTLYPLLGRWKGRDWEG